MIIVSSQIVQAFNLGVTLVGSDGTVWDLVGGPVKVGSGLAGLGSPDPEHWWRDAATLDGSYHLGQRTPRGDVMVPVRVTGGNSGEWLDNQRSFMSSVTSGDICQLKVTVPGEVARVLEVRYTGGGNGPYSIDPALIRHASYPLEFAADYPFWTVGSTGGIFTGPTFGVVQLGMVGDVAPWPKWTLYGPYDTATASIYASAGASNPVSEVVIAASVTAGHSRVIQMSPYANVIAVRDETGSSAWNSVNSRTFAPIPVGDSFWVSVGFTGIGSGNAVAVLDYTPAYRQAW